MAVEKQEPQTNETTLKTESVATPVDRLVMRHCRTARPR